MRTFALPFLFFACSSDPVTPGPIGTPDGGGSDGSSGTPDGSLGDAGSDAPVDSGPLPLTQAIDDGTVPLPHTMPTCAPSLGFAAGGTAFLAHSQSQAALGGVRVHRLMGRTWVPVGGTLNDADQDLNINICPAMAVAPDGTPYVGFVSQSATTRQVRVRRFVGGAWVDALSIDRPTSDFAPALAMSMTLDPSGMPVLALVEFVGTEHFVTARRWSGSAFVQEGPALNPASRSVRVTTATNGNIVALHTQQDGFGLKAAISTLAGGTWNTSPTVDGTPDSTIGFFIDDVDTNGAVTLATYSVLPTSAPSVVRTFQSAGAALPETKGAFASTLVLGGKVLQTYQRDVSMVDIRVHNGTTWGTPLPLPFPAVSTRLVRSASAAYIAYREGDTAKVVLVSPP